MSESEQLHVAKKSKIAKDQSATIIVDDNSNMDSNGNGNGHLEDQHREEKRSEKVKQRATKKQKQVAEYADDDVLIAKSDIDRLDVIKDALKTKTIKDLTRAVLDMMTENQLYKEFTNTKSSEKKHLAEDLKKMQVRCAKKGIALGDLVMPLTDYYLEKGAFGLLEYIKDSRMDGKSFVPFAFQCWGRQNKQIDEELKHAAFNPAQGKFGKFMYADNNRQEYKSAIQRTQFWYLFEKSVRPELENQGLANERLTWDILRQYCRELWNKYDQAVKDTKNIKLKAYTNDERGQRSTIYTERYCWPAQLEPKTSFETACWMFLEVYVIAPGKYKSIYQYYKDQKDHYEELRPEGEGDEQEEEDEEDEEDDEDQEEESNDSVHGEISKRRAQEQKSHLIKTKSLGENSSFKYKPNQQHK